VITGTLRIDAGAALFSQAATIILGCADTGQPARPCAPGETGGAIMGDPQSAVTMDGNSGVVPGFAVVSDFENAAASRLGEGWAIDGLYVPQGEWISPLPAPGLVR
jgi:hypothetical protein